MELIFEMNARLAEDLDDRAFSRHFAENVAQIETLFWEIIDGSGMDVRPPFKRRRHASARQHALRHLFEITNRAEETAGHRAAPLSS